MIAAAAAAAGFYLGALSAGGRTLEIGLELKGGPAALSGSYYYFPMGDPIPLRGTVAADGSLALEEGPPGAVTGRWSGRLAKGALAGTWKDARTGRAWAFRLRRSEEASDFFAGEPQNVKAGTMGPLTYRMARVPGGRFADHQVPIITGFADARVISAVNAALFTQARMAHCEQPPDDHQLEARVSFAGEGVYSVQVTESWMCGAAYPTDGTDTSVTFDLGSGQPLGWDDIVASEHRQRADELMFAPQWAQARADPAPSAGSDDDFDCLDRFREESGMMRGAIGFRFAPEGLVAIEEFPHVIAACDVEVTVPYAVLRPVAAPGSALARLAAADAPRPPRYTIRARGAAPLEWEPARKD